jgi:hypothetical protein
VPAFTVIGPSVKVAIDGGPYVAPVPLKVERFTGPVMTIAPACGAAKPIAAAMATLVRIGRE